MNGVPVRRVNQAYVIATSTKVSIDAKSAAKIDDSYFTKAKTPKSQKKKKGEDFFAADAEVRTPSRAHDRCRTCSHDRRRPHAACTACLRRLRRSCQLRRTPFPIHPPFCHAAASFHRLPPSTLTRARATLVPRTCLRRRRSCRRSARRTRRRWTAP